MSATLLHSNELEEKWAAAGEDKIFYRREQLEFFHFFMRN